MTEEIRSTNAYGSYTGATGATGGHERSGSEKRVRHERRDAMEHRQRILQVARVLFTQYGVDAVSMHQIAKAAEVGQGTLYRRYASKGDLCMDLLFEHHERLIAGIATVCAENAEKSAMSRLDSVIALNVSFLEEQNALLSPVILMEMHNTKHKGASNKHDDPARKVFQSELHDRFASLLAEAIQSKEIPQLDPSFTSDALLFTLNPIFYQIQRQERGLSSHEILQGVRRIYITGITAPRVIE